MLPGHSVKADQRGGTTRLLAPATLGFCVSRLFGGVRVLKESFSVVVPLRTGLVSLIWFQLSRNSLPLGCQLARSRWPKGERKSFGCVLPLSRGETQYFTRRTAWRQSPVATQVSRHTFREIWNCKTSGDSERAGLRFPSLSVSHGFAPIGCAHSTPTTRSKIARPEMSMEPVSIR